MSLANHHRAVTAHFGKVTRIDVSQAVEADTDTEGENASNRKVPIREGANIDDRLFSSQNPIKEADRQRAQTIPSTKTEVPSELEALLRPFLQNILQARRRNPAIDVRSLTNRTAQAVRSSGYRGQPALARQW